MREGWFWFQCGRPGVIRWAYKSQSAGENEFGHFRCPFRCMTGYPSDVASMGLDRVYPFVKRSLITGASADARAVSSGSKGGGPANWTFRQRLESLPKRPVSRARMVAQFSFHGIGSGITANRRGWWNLLPTFSHCGRDFICGWAVLAAAAIPVSHFSEPGVHSRPGAPNVLFINFSGETITSGQWLTEVGRSSICGGLRHGCGL